MTAIAEAIAATAVVASRTPDAARRWQAARNVLAVRLDNLGDLLMTTPALAAVRESLPAARLTLLASPSGAALAPHLPMLDEAIVYEAPWMPRPAAGTGTLGEADRRMIDRLAERRFDAAIVFTVCKQSALPAALLCRLAGIGLRLAHARENPYGLLSDWVPDADRPVAGVRHEVTRQLDLVRAVGCAAADQRLVLRHGAADAAGARRALAAPGVDGPTAPYFVVHPGSTAASRRWPAGRYGQAAQALAEATGWRAVLAGGGTEQAAVAEALAAMDGAPRARALPLAGRLGLGELAALIAGARVTLCNNSGPAHIAAAVGAPVVVLYALTNPQHTPWRTPARVLNRDVPCRNCLQSVCPQPRRACLDDVTVADVVAAALELGGAVASSPPAAAVPSPADAASLRAAPAPETR